MDWQLRPARDQGLSPTARLQSQGRERGLGSVVIGAAWRGVTGVYLRTVLGLRVTGRENVPAPPFVMIANHSSHLDALTLSAALPWRSAQVAFALAAGDTFFTSTVGSAFSAYAVNALPVWRKRTSAADLDTFRQRLIEDRAVFILFPEGTRSRTGEIGPFKSGIGALVAGSPIAVVPCYLDGARAAWPPDRKFPGRGQLHLTIDPPLSFADVAMDRAGCLQVAERCEQAVRGLAAQYHSE